jgi:hypothetical protein
VWNVSGGSLTVQNPADVATGECRVVAEDFDAVTGVGANITLTETNATALVSITGQRIDDPGAVISTISPHRPTVDVLPEQLPWLHDHLHNQSAEGCTLTLGYWKTHGGTGPQANAWPVNSLTLGSVTYTQAQLLEHSERVGERKRADLWPTNSLRPSSTSRTARAARTWPLPSPMPMP